MTKVYDVIIIGAGSIGVPTALKLAQENLKVCVIDKMSSPGQGQNKKAIGGIRATHSDKSKIKLCKRSLEIFSTWREVFGDDIGFKRGGYAFPAYTKTDELAFKKLIKKQKSYGLNIKWITDEEFIHLVPGVNKEGLLGSTYSPDDGSASPLLSINAFYFKSIEFGAKYSFKENVRKISFKKNEFIVQTNKNTYKSIYLINCAGNESKSIGQMIGIDIPILPDSHEGAISEPVNFFFKPMIVDIREDSESMNYYFYQNSEFQVVMCITPKPGPIIKP